MVILWGVLTIVALTAATGYFVAQEFAFLTVNRARLRQAAEAGDHAAQRAYRVTQRLSFMLSGAQFGITVTALLAGYVAEPLLGAGLANLLGLAGVPAAVSLSVSVVLALVFATVVQMVLGELLPKNWAIAQPETLARALARSTLVYLAMAGPLIRLFDAAANRLLRAVGIQPVEELPQGATPEDLQRIIDASEEGGHLDPGLSRLLDRGLDFRGLTAGQAMTPRVDVDTVHADEPVGRVVELLDTGHSRFPVTGSDVDDLIGVIGVAEILTVAAEQRATTPVRAVASAPLLVPESLPLPAVLERLRTERRQLACVMDEYGGFAGVITLEDLAEELIGEIHDEDDHAHPVPEQAADGSWAVPGRLRLDEIADATSVALPAHDAYDTISGLVLRHLGRTAQVGDVVHVDQKFVIEVLEVARHVPHLVRLVTRADADVDVEVRQ